jgi:hypothetical protein
LREIIALPSRSGDRGRSSQELNQVAPAADDFGDAAGRAFLPMVIADQRDGQQKRKESRFSGRQWRLSQR